jgi:hypothetical protein
MPDEALRQFDAAVLRLRFDDVPCDDLPRLLRLGMLLGRYRLVRRLRHLISEDDYRSFLRYSALPQVPIGGDVVRGFAVDEQILAEIAAELEEPLPRLLAATVHHMLRKGSRHVAKLYVMARLSGDTHLIESLQKPFDARTRHRRIDLAPEIRRRWGVELVQSGDDDDYNPKSAYVFAGDDLVIKENLRLRVRAGGYGHSQERELLDELRHPRIVELVDVAHLHHHELLLLRRVHGQTLDGRRHPQARRIVQQLAELLAYLHGHNVLHLDVKPQNLIFDGRDVTLCDFGMAAHGSMLYTVPSTLEYVAPETTLELMAGDYSDVFQLGIVMHQLYTGRHPFADGEGVEVAVANLRDPPRMERDLPELERDLPEIERVLLRQMLAKDPMARPRAAEVAARLA